MKLSEAKAKFARLVASAPGVDDDRVCKAFAQVPRERFSGSGPWLILDGDGYVESHGNDPSLLYDDVVVALMPEKRINNGQPTLHARNLSAARVRPGENVLHVGCGSGYYTAILAELATESGTVEAWDIEPALVEKARTNLAHRPNVAVAHRDGTTAPIPAKDLIYVCAGCTHPVRSWAEALANGGRLLFPLTPGWDFGAVLMVTRDADAFRARFVGRCSFIPCVGASEERGELVARAAFSRGSLDEVASLRFGKPPGTPDVWLSGNDWWLSTAPPGRFH